MSNNRTITERLAIDLQILIEQQNGSMTGGFASLNILNPANPDPAEVGTNCGIETKPCINASDDCIASINDFCQNTRKDWCEGSTNTGSLKCTQGSRMGAGEVISYRRHKL